MAENKWAFPAVITSIKWSFLSFGTLPITGDLIANLVLAHIFVKVIAAVTHLFSAI